MIFSLQDKIALITGATGGIGQSIAKVFHKQGATVALSGTRKEVLEELANSLGERVYVFPCSLGDTDQVETLIPTVENQLGKLDILVNNAGITKDGLLLRMKDEDWNQVLDINLTSTFRLCRAVCRGMMKRRYGRIINISSVVGVTGNPGQTNYTATKAALIGFSKSLAQELATRGITVNCVAPGFIETPMTHDIPSTAKEHIIAKIPMGELGTPEDIANGVLYLASAEARYITGQTLHINGGMAMY